MRHIAFGTLLGMLFFGSAVAQTAESPEQPRIVTTLQMDPESPQEFRGWWVAKDALLLINANGGYQLWKGIDRYELPQEVGRWNQRNHAVIQLESYAIPRTPASRFSMWLKNDALMADLSRSTAKGKATLFQKTPRPPTAPEDAMIGTWEGPGGHLVLRQDLSFYWTAPESRVPGSTTLSSQGGEWSCRGDQLRMAPTARHQLPIIEGVVLNSKKRITALKTSFGELRRVPRPDLPAPTPSEEAPVVSKKPAPDKG